MARAVFVVRSNSRRGRSVMVRRNKSKGYPKRVHFGTKAGHEVSFRAKRAHRPFKERVARAARAKLRRRKNGVVVLRSNGIAARANGRRHRFGKRRNGIAVRQNGIGINRNGRFGRRRNGIIGGITALALPVAAGALSLGVVHFALGYADMIPGDPLSYVEPAAYTIGGLGASLLVGLLPIPMAYKALFGSAAVVGGAAVDAFRYLSAPAAIPAAGWGDGGMWALGSSHPAQIGMSMGPQAVRQGAYAGWVHGQR